MERGGNWFFFFTAHAASVTLEKLLRMGNSVPLEQGGVGHKKEGILGKGEGKRFCVNLLKVKSLSNQAISKHRGFITPHSTSLRRMPGRHIQDIFQVP